MCHELIIQTNPCTSTGMEYCFSLKGCHNRYGTSRLLTSLLTVLRVIRGHGKYQSSSPQEKNICKTINPQGIQSTSKLSSKETKNQYSFMKANSPMQRDEHPTAVLLPKELWMSIKTWGGWINDWRSQNVNTSL